MSIPWPETGAQRVDMSQDGGLHRDLSQVRYNGSAPLTSTLQTLQSMAHTNSLLKLSKGTAKVIFTFQIIGQYDIVQQLEMVVII